MKSSKADISSKFHAIPQMKYEDQKLTSSAGLVVFQALFSVLNLRERLEPAFSHLKQSSQYGFHRIFLGLIIHILLGHRKLSDSQWYANDPMVLRLTGLSQSPDSSTLSRSLNRMNGKVFENLRKLNREMVGDRLMQEKSKRMTLDFDGSVLGTGRFAEGTAVGYNKNKKGTEKLLPTVLHHLSMWPSFRCSSSIWKRS